MNRRVTPRVQYLPKAQVADLCVARHYGTANTAVSDKPAGRSFDSAKTAGSTIRRFNLAGKRGGSTVDPRLAAALLDGAAHGISRRSIEAAVARWRAGQVVVDRRLLKAEIRDVRREAAATALDADAQLTAMREQRTEHLRVLARLCTEKLMSPAMRSTASTDAGKYAAAVKEICRTEPLKLRRAGRRAS